MEVEKEYRKREDKRMEKMRCRRKKMKENGGREGMENRRRGRNGGKKETRRFKSWTEERKMKVKRKW